MSQLEQIKKLHQKGQIKKAIDGYQSYLKKNPNDDDAHFGLALAYKEMKQFKKALSSANAAIQLAPNAERYLQFKGQMHLSLGDSKEALTAFKASIKHNPNLYFSYLAIGDIYLIQEKHIKAEEQYRLALRVQEEAAPASVKLSKLMLLTSRIDEAESVLQAAALHQPEDPELKLNQGLLNLETGEFGYAELHFKKLLEDHKNYPLAKVNLAISLMDSDRQQAAKIIEQLIEAKFHAPELMVAAGMLALKQNHPSEAVDYLLTVCRSSLAFPSWLMALSQAYVALGQLDKAIGALKRILKQGKNDRAVVMLGMIELRKKQYPEAVESLQSISEKSPQYMASLKHLIKAHHYLGDWQKVIEVANQLLAQNPDLAEVTLLKSHAYGHMNKNDEALNTLEAGLKNNALSHMHNDYHLHAGLLLDSQKEYPAAWQHFSQQQNDSPNPVSLLTKDHEKTVQKWPTESGKNQPVFVFSDTTTGHSAFIERLQQHNITALTDRFKPTARQDLFSQPWQIADLDNLPETRCHLLRKKYHQHLKRIHEQGPFADFIPKTAINMALIKKVFPAAKVIILDRNMADRHLHQLVFANGQYSADDFRKLKNQMIALNPNIRLVDIDALLDNDDSVLTELSTLFSVPVDAREAKQVMPMKQFMLPKDRWKAYRDYLNPDTDD